MVLQCLVLGSVLFKIFISDLYVRVKSTLAKLANDTKLWRSAAMHQGRLTIQADPDRLVRWADQDQMLLNTDKCECSI